jgi:hypothetical protein
MGIRSFKSLPRTLTEWGRFFNETHVEPSPDSVGTTELKDGQVTLAKIQNIPAGTILGRDTAPAGVVKELNVTGGLELTGTAIRRSALEGDVTAAAGSSSTTIADKAVTYAKIQDVSATNRILGRQTAGSGAVEEITCTAAGRALLDDADASAQRTTLGLGTAATVNTGSSGATIPLLNATATVSAAWTFSSQVVFSDVGQSILMQSTLPLARWVETDASANNSRWRMLVSAERFSFQTPSDDETTAGTVWDVDRTETAVDRMAMGAVLRVVNLGSDPASGSNGDVYYNTGTNKFRGYAAGAWTDLH